MSPDRPAQSVLIAFAHDVAAFAATQSNAELAKLIGFFHLARDCEETSLELCVGVAGRITLKIETVARAVEDLHRSA